jgi:uncharacterized phage protein gp47/JayE
MSNPYEKSFDDILEQVLIDYKALDEAPDVSAGSMPFIMGSVLSSMLWGLYRYQDYINKQHFADTADTENLDRHGSIYALAREEDETDSDYLTRILARIRQAPAGGNKLDFETWALDQDNCYYETGGTTYYNEYVTVVPIVDGPGTVGVYTIIDDETEEATAIAESLRTATETYINTVRPVGMISCTVVAATHQDQAIGITIPLSSNVDTADLETAIEDYLKTFSPGQTLYISKIAALAIDYGAAYCNVTTPAADTTIANSLFFRPGTVTITEV